MPRDYRYVVDHGEIYRMTEIRYRRYILAGTKAEAPNAGDYGSLIATAVTVTRFSVSDFNDLFAQEHAADVVRWSSVTCPACGAAPREACRPARRHAYSHRQRAEAARQRGER